MTGKTKLILAGCVVLGAVLAWEAMRHAKANADSVEPGDGSGAARVAAVVKVERRDLGVALTLAGAFKPFQDVDLHAKVAGYIKAIYVDVGSHVKVGQTLAVLEVPELAAELSGADAAVRRAKEEIRRARGDVARAQSSHAAAHSMYERLSQASQQRPGLVAQQDVDDAQAKDLGAEAQVSSAQAALDAAEQALQVAQATQKQYAALSDYTRITAPFAGVVTIRYADTGSLIAAGTASSTQSIAVVRLAEVSKLRLVLPIPESVAGQIHLGDVVKVHVQALNQDIVGKVSRFAGSLDEQTRTMETEIDCENRAGKLLPGMYAETAVQVADRRNVLSVPMEAVTQTAGEARVLAVNPQNVVEERKVTLGLRGKSRVEIVNGLTEGDRVIIGNQSQFRDGEKVTPREVQLPSVDEGGTN